MRGNGIDVRDSRWGGGADPGGERDSTGAIQAALDAAASSGGAVCLPAGTYRISSALRVYGYTSLVGEGDAATVIKQVTRGASGLTGVDVTQFRLSGVQVLGAAGDGGKGISFTLDKHANTGFLQFDSVWVRGFGHGVKIDTPIVSVFNRVVASGCGGNGFYFHSATSGTSCTLNSCFADGCGAAGYRFDASCYSALNGCAADGNGTGYQLTGCQSVTLSGCGAEATHGDSFVLAGGYGNSLISPRVYENGHYGIHVTGAEKCLTVVGAVDNTPGQGASAFIVSDPGTTGSVLNCNNTSPNLLAGAVSVLSDGGGVRTSAVSARTGDCTLTSADSVILGDASEGAFTVTLPSAGTVGLRYTVVKTEASGNAVTLAATAGETINGSAVQRLRARGERITVISDGTEWWQIG